MHPEFPQQPDLIHLNHAGVGPWPKRTRDAVSRFAALNTSRGPADYPRWLEAAERLRGRAARLTSTLPEAIALVGSTSEGLSTVAFGLDWKPGDNVVFARQEFPSNRMPWQAVGERFGVAVREVDLAGERDPEQALIAAMDERTRILPVSAVQWADGLRMDLRRLGDACRAVGALFCVDAIQWLGYSDLDAPALGIDVAVADGHKWLLAPEGLGLMCLSEKAMERVQLTRFGWHMTTHPGDFEREQWLPARTARRFEAGSPNTLGAHALEASLSLLEETGFDSVEAAVNERVAHLLDRIRDEPELTPVTPTDPERRAGIMTFHVRGADADRLVGSLRERGVYAAARCGGVRFSPHFYTPFQSIDRALDMLLDTVR